MSTRLVKFSGVLILLISPACNNGSTQDGSSQSNSLTNKISNNNTEKPIVENNKASPEVQAAWLAAKWGMGGYAQCSYWGTQYLNADPDVRDSFPQFEEKYDDNLIRLKSMAVPSSDEQIFETYVDGLVKTYENAPAETVTRALKKCISDMNDAASLKASDLPTTSPAPATAPVSQSAKQPAPDESDHAPFALLLPGRWAADGEACDAASNFIFTDDKYEHGEASGTYIFAELKLILTSDHGGNSEGRVTPVEPGKITINWKGWKSVSYSKCVD